MHWFYNIITYKFPNFHEVITSVGVRHVTHLRMLVQEKNILIQTSAFVKHAKFPVTWGSLHSRIWITCWFGTLWVYLKWISAFHFIPFMLPPTQKFVVLAWQCFNICASRTSRPEVNGPWLASIRTVRHVLEKSVDPALWNKKQRMHWDTRFWKFFFHMVWVLIHWHYRTHRNHSLLLATLYLVMSRQFKSRNWLMFMVITLLDAVTSAFRI